MLDEIKNLPVGKTIIAAIGTILIPIIIVVVVVTVYATKLGFEAQGAPDQALVNQFAESIGAWLSPILKIIITFLAVKWLKRKSPEIGLMGGLFFAAIIVAASLILIFVFGEAFQLIQLLWIALILIAGALAGFTGNK